MTEQQPLRSAFYVDGFNLYYAIHDLQKNHLKWLDFFALANLLIPSRTETVVKIMFCTAYNKRRDFEKLTRHQKYVQALEYTGVEVVLGHYVQGGRDCNQCNHSWVESEEKETDVNVAIHLISDAHNDVFDHAYLVTADSDQAATAKLFKQQFPGKLLSVVTPPGRPTSKSIEAHKNGGVIKITESHLERCLLPRAVQKPDKTHLVVRPREYTPPWE